MSINISGQHNNIAFNLIVVKEGPGIRISDAEDLGLGWNAIVTPSTPIRIDRSKRIRVHNNVHDDGLAGARETPRDRLTSVNNDDGWPVLAPLIWTRAELGQALYEQLFGRIDR